MESTYVTYLKNLGVTLEKGTRSETDKIIKFEGKALNMMTLGIIFSQMCKYQNTIRSTGDGAKFVSEYLEDIRKSGSLTVSIKEKYGISKSENTTIQLNGKPITLEIFGAIYSEMCKVQSNLYPHGKGSLYLKEYLDEIEKKGSFTEEIRRKFKF